MTLLHRACSKSSPECPVTLPNGMVIQPSPVVRWLGVFFDRKLSFRTHINRKVTSASRALQMISRLKTSERGLSSQHLRQLYTSCVTPILDYGAEAWWRRQKVQASKATKRSLQKDSGSVPDVSDCPYGIRGIPTTPRDSTTTYLPKVCLENHDITRAPPNTTEIIHFPTRIHVRHRSTNRHKAGLEQRG